MRKQSVVRKVVATICGIVSLVLLVGGVILIMSERNLVENIIREHNAKMRNAIDDREQAQKQTLQQNIAFNTNLLRLFGGMFLYHLEVEPLRDVLRLYVTIPEVLAVNVVDESGKSVAAAWKMPEISVADALPANLTLNKNLSMQMDYIRNQEKIGSFQVYYTEALLAEQIKTVRTQEDQEAEISRKDSFAQLNRVIISQTLGGVCILAILLASLVIFLKALVTNPLHIIEHVAHTLAHFDLTVNIAAKRQDEIGRLLTSINNVVQAFRTGIHQVQELGAQLSTSSAELFTIAKQQANTVMNQVESTDHVVTSVEQISVVASQLVQMMQHVASMSKETAGLVSSGQVDLSRMGDAMYQMESASKSISDRLETINEKAENITTVVTTITKVADQTNLLSLNAAIEAEKAGEYGRGFAVVSQEIRRLADQTAVATLDIEQMVQEMQSAVSAGVTEMGGFIAKVRLSAEDAGSISLKLTHIIERVQALAPNFEDVNMAMEHQSESAQEINNAMVTLSEQMQQTMDSLRESYTVIEQLNHVARGLQEEMSRFKVS